MKEFLEYIVKDIVTEPEKVTVTKKQLENGENAYEYVIDCSDEDKGRVIGKNGKIIQAIRDLALVKARKENLRIRIIVE